MAKGQQSGIPGYIRYRKPPTYQMERQTVARFARVATILPSFLSIPHGHLPVDACLAPVIETGVAASRKPTHPERETGA